MTTPALTGLSPNQGPTAGGTTVTLTGTNLGDVTTVRFGTTAAAFTIVSATQITATAPPGSTGPVQVTATSPGGTSGGLAYYYVALPVLTGVAPGQGPTAGGTAVTLTGTNFSQVTTVRFGTTTAAFSVLSATQINSIAPSAPAGSPGPAQVTVTSPGGTSGGLAYYYVALPVLTGVSPGQGPIAGGTTVTLTGANLLNATSVRFGTTAAAYSVVSATQITATAPPGSTGFAQVTVITPGGTSGGVGYQYVALPVLTGVSPGEGPTAGGTTVTLTGTNLGDVSAVRFGTTAAAFSVVSATQITATAPTGSAGAVQVTVISAGGTSAGLTYTRIQLPSI
ncbi:IPT/TIG domain-containing protein [Streptomyces lunaelactis]|uniref:IPT/TIG domain-containing protein n=1 Tax=Streptomyces lunaelactis TaxID=1535768 RepID=UPI0015848D24|nr:IPT/TIG domain-containing protein [Streptomyces lunaelactis]NUK03949.1 IPT/TIG domain-containing protein [Streptomyces lunaelactis]